MATPEATARELLDVAPAIVRTIRTEMRAHRMAELSVPQFRTMGFLNWHAGASLSDVAEHIGLTLPTMSKLVDGLVTRRMVTRETYAGDRRRVTLQLTSRGQSTWQAARDATQAHLSKMLGTLGERDRAIVVEAMEILRPIFVPVPEGKRHNGEAKE